MACDGVTPPCVGVTPSRSTRSRVGSERFLLLGLPQYRRLMRKRVLLLSTPGDELLLPALNPLW